MKRVQYIVLIIFFTALSFSEAKAFILIYTCAYSNINSNLADQTLYAIGGDRDDALSAYGVLSGGDSNCQIIREYPDLGWFAFACETQSYGGQYTCAWSVGKGSKEEAKSEALDICQSKNGDKCYGNVFIVDDRTRSPLDPGTVEQYGDGVESF